MKTVYSLSYSTFLKNKLTKISLFGHFVTEGPSQLMLKATVHNMFSFESCRIKSCKYQNNRVGVGKMILRK